MGESWIGDLDEIAVGGHEPRGQRPRGAERHLLPEDRLNGELRSIDRARGAQSRALFNDWGEAAVRSEEHTSELQSHSDLVCRLLLDTHTPQRYTLSLHDALPI